VRFAVAFCNQQSTPKLSVCVIDVDSGARAWLDVPAAFDRGAAGITRRGDELLVACQPGGIVRYGPRLEPLALLPTPEAGNLHSILYRDEERAVYVVSARDDTLYRYVLDDTGARFVRCDTVYCADPQGRGQDRYHLNSVAFWNGEPYVTCFGPTEGATHRDRRNGRVLRVADGSTVVDGLYHPHSLFVHDDELLVIESQARVVRRVAGGEPCAWHIDGGYPRGIVAGAPGRVWVGVSALRRESMSLGTANVMTSTSPVDYCTRLVELDLGTGELGRSIDLTLLAAEVFDVHALPLPDAFVPDPDGGLPARIEALEESYRAMRAAKRDVEHELGSSPWQRARRFARRVRSRLS